MHCIPKNTHSLPVNQEEDFTEKDSIKKLLLRMEIQKKSNLRYKIRAYLQTRYFFSTLTYLFLTILAAVSHTSSSRMLHGCTGNATLQLLVARASKSPRDQISDDDRQRGRGATMRSRRGVLCSVNPSAPSWIGPRYDFRACGRNSSINEPLNLQQKTFQARGCFG